MLYEMAKHHDHWPGQDYEGSSARGAMKGWHKNGVCSEHAWPYDPNNPGYLNHERQLDALNYPLGAYYRVQRRRSELHAALNEVEAVFATAQIHSGWHNLQDGAIPFGPEQEEKGGHAFAIIGYTQKGFTFRTLGARAGAGSLLTALATLAALSGPMPTLTRTCGMPG
jgi:hypothetical protein